LALILAQLAALAVVTLKSIARTLTTSPVATLRIGNLTLRDQVLYGLRPAKAIDSCFFGGIGCLFSGLVVRKTSSRPSRLQLIPAASLKRRFDL
jgi:hypothetical protein